MSESSDNEPQSPTRSAPFGGKPRPYTPPALPRLRDGSEMSMFIHSLWMDVEQVQRETLVSVSEDLASSVNQTIRLSGHWRKSLWQMGDHARDESLDGLPLTIEINRNDGSQPFYNDWDPPDVGIGLLSHHSKIDDKDYPYPRSLLARVYAGAEEFERMSVEINGSNRNKENLTIAMAVKGWGNDWNQEVPLLVVDIKVSSSLSPQLGPDPEFARVDGVREAVVEVRDSVDSTREIMISIAGRLESFGHFINILVFSGIFAALSWALFAGIGTFWGWITHP
jgi:hypothetical protein